ncbi:MAG: Flp pilus assembly protein CpaB [Myxococcales bacterium]|nr:Flp pilus assembly protein CpaB [Deltaproteobacteria bacterium]NNE17151.1 Flp pilus assembly protein CpaB [Myxococcales bacterium]
MNRIAILAPVIVAALGFVLLGLYVRQFQREATGGEPIALLAMSQNVASGVPLTEQMLFVRTLPQSYVEERQVVASALSRVLGVRSSIDLEANQTLLWTDLSTAPRDRGSLSNRIPKGMRAMNIAGTGRRSFSDLMRPGDRVDVLLTKAKPGSDAKIVTIPLLQNVLVLAIGERFGTADTQTSPLRSDSVTLLLTIDQASLVAQARRDATLNLVLRNENDLEINVGLGETDDSDVLEQEKRARRQRRLRIEKVD